MSTRLGALLGVLAALAAAGPATASAATAGGAKAPGPRGGAGGAEYGQPVSPPRAKRPIASRLSLSTKKVREDRTLPRLRLRIDQRGVKRVSARIVVWPRKKGGQVLRVDLGRVRTNRTFTVTWPKDARLAPGRYTVRVHAKDPDGSTLRRTRRRSGRTTLVVRRAPRPTPAPAPAPAATDGGVFPVQGPHSYGGDGSTFGSDRGTHRHEGQDVIAAEGTPVVAPLPGVVRHVDHQKDGAGHYVVMDADDGRSFFFAHCRSGSVVAVEGARVAAGTRLCGVGSTGRSSGPHLHFEIWIGGWRVSKDSRPVDPLPQLRAWDR